MIEGLKLALKHSTKYEDRMYLSFLIKVWERKVENSVGWKSEIPPNTISYL